MKPTKSMKPNPNPFSHRASFWPVLSCAAVCIGASVSSLHAQASSWTGDEDTDWNNPANWTPNNVPSGGGATINTDSGNIATITTNISATPTDFYVGDGSEQSGQVNHISGSAQSGNGNWISIGLRGGTGVYNLANTGASGTGISGYAQGSGSLTATGGAHLNIGGAFGDPNSTGTFNMNTSGTLTAGQIHVGRLANGNGLFNLESGDITSGDVYVGNGNAGGLGTFNLAGGSLTTTGWVKVSHNGGTGIMNLADTGGTGGALTGFAQGTASMSVGTVSDNNRNLRIGGDGANGGGTGTLNVNTSGSITIHGNQGHFRIGTEGSHGVLNLDNGTINVGGIMTVSFGHATKGAATGILNQGGGIINVQNSNQSWIGNEANSHGAYNLSGGTFNVDNWLVVGRDGGTGILNVTGGTINKTGAASDLVVGADNASSNGTFTLSGGSVSVERDTSIGKNGGTGIFTVSGAGELQTRHLLVGEGSGNGTANLDGGTVEANAVRGFGANSTLVLGGGTLRARADEGDFISGLSTANITGTGFTIDTQQFDVTAAQAFSGNGALAKTGSGTLTLTGDSSYNGAISVNEGSLIVNGSLASANTTVASGALLGGSGSASSLNVLGTLAPGNSIGSFGAGNVNFATGSTFHYELDSDSLDGDLLHATGTLGIASGAILELVESASGTLSLGDKLTLISYNGGWNPGDLFTWEGSPLQDDSIITLGANKWLFDYNDTDGGDNFADDQVGATSYVTMTVVPEPSAALLGGIGLLILCSRRRQLA